MLAITGAIAMFSKLSALFTGIDFGAILPAVGTAAGVLFTSIQKYWQYYLIAILGLGLAFTTHEWQHETGKYKTEAASHAADIKSYKDAQAQYEAEAQAEKTALTNQSRIEANAAQTNYSSLLATYHANLLRYEASKGNSGRPDSGQSGGATQGSDGPSTSAVLPSGPITISPDDAGICAENTARLQAGHDWALSVTKDAKNGQTPSD